jgi:hypothetical protein
MIRAVRKFIDVELQHSRTCATYVRFEVLAVVVMKVAIFWDITPCSPYVRFGGIYHLHVARRLLALWLVA